MRNGAPLETRCPKITIWPGSLSAELSVSQPTPPWVSCSSVMPGYMARFRPISHENSCVGSGPVWTRGAGPQAAAVIVASSTATTATITRLALPARSSSAVPPDRATSAFCLVRGRGRNMGAGAYPGNRFPTTPLVVA